MIVVISNVLQLMDRQSFMWGQLNMSYNDYSFRIKIFGKCLVIVYVHLWLSAMQYDCTNIRSIQLH